MEDPKTEHRHEMAKTEQTGPSSRTSRNVAVLSSTLKWKARVPTPHPKKAAKKKSSEPKMFDKGDQEERDEGDMHNAAEENVNLGFVDEAKGVIESNQTCVDVQPETGSHLNEERKKPRLARIYIFLAVIFGVALVAVLIFIGVNSLRILPIEDTGNVTTAAINDTEDGDVNFRSSTVPVTSS